MMWHVDGIGTHQVLAFAVAAFIVIAIPGPSVVFVIGRALAYGRPTALATVLGNSLGLLAVLVLVSLGLGSLVTRSETVFTVLKLVGAAYLVWLGVQAIRNRRGIQVGDAGTAPPGAPTGLPVVRAIRQGFVVGFSNPKAFMIFAALLPQFLGTGADGSAPVQMLALGLVAFGIGLVSDSVWAVAAAWLRAWFDGSPARGRALGRVGGFSMIGLGVALAVTGRPD